MLTNKENMQGNEARNIRVLEVRRKRKLNTERRYQTAGVLIA